MIHLADKGLNGILADEMVRRMQRWCLPIVDVARVCLALSSWSLIDTYRSLLYRRVSVKLSSRLAFLRISTSFAAFKALT